MQIKTYEEAERHYLEQLELVKQLKAENAELQRDARTIASLQAEVTELRTKVDSCSNFPMGTQLYAEILSSQKDTRGQA